MGKAESELPRQAERENNGAIRAPLDDGVWISAALSTLAEKGIDGLRIETLSRALGVTKGSFYWRFKDRDDLLVTMLDGWRRRATLDVIAAIEERGRTAQQRLHELIRFPFTSPRSEHGANVELSIRLWARTDARAHKALNEVDELRLRYIASLFGELGFSEIEAAARASLAYSFMRVGSTLKSVRADMALLVACIDVLEQTGGRIT